MTKIDPTALAQLMQRKGLSLQELAKISKIDKQTLWRIKTGQMRSSRDRTIRQVADALRVDPKVLTGEEPIPAIEPKAGNDSDTTQLNIRISNQARNALHLIQERYFVGAWKVLELAPLLFCWAAEQSLARRRILLGELKQAYLKVDNLEEQFSHIAFPSISAEDLDHIIEEERRSIDNSDIWGLTIDWTVEPTTATFANPFETFLHEAVSAFEDVIEFEECKSDDFPSYCICPDEAENLVGGDKELAHRIMNGVVALHEMPKDIRNDGTAQDRADWVKDKVDEFFGRVMKKQIEKSNLVKFPDLTQRKGDSK